MSRKSKFDASQSLLGYIYQIPYALYLSLERLRETTDEDIDEYNISIEKLDDVAVEKASTTLDVKQTKYHNPEKSKQNLNNRSEDLWKTIRVWVDLTERGQVTLGKTEFALITTQTYAKDTIASWLSDDIELRNTTKALKEMLVVCKNPAIRIKKAVMHLSPSVIRKENNFFKVLLLFVTQKIMNN